MKIKWNGHASFTITSDKGIVIVTDPYDPSGYGGVLKYEPVKDRADGVIISHDHADHNYVDSLEGSPEVLKGSGEIKGFRLMVSNRREKLSTFIPISSRVPRTMEMICVRNQHAGSLSLGP